ncbi:MAG TPA: DUF3592 domain-containing protein [Candidatus Nitrosopolaris sp.]|nr:DUF3592 domain-containing protein [Candidatus Nitrosopolaris sp.]
MFLGAYFLLFCALTLGVAAGWQAYWEQVESTRWPAVTAQLSDCYVHTWYDSWHGRARALHSVECSFRYEVGAVPYVVKSRVGDELSIVRGQIDLPRPAVTLSSLRQWVRRHPTGDAETIHYDPARPVRISLVGVEDDIKWKTPSGYLRGAMTFAAPGGVLLLVGVAWRRAASGPTARPSA